MFALAVELLTGRYTATTFNNRDMAEWPPHPARLFSALVAAWADADEPSTSEREALLWLENQPPPELVCDPVGAVAHRALVTHYVPVNDASALGRDVGRSTYEDLRTAGADLAAVVGRADKQATRSRTAAQRLATRSRDAIIKASTATGTESGSVITAARQVLPEERTRQPRTFPTVRPATPRFTFRWPDAAPDERTFAALAALTSRVGRIGHSSTLVQVGAASSGEGEPTFVTDPAGEVALRVPRNGLLDALDRQFLVHRGIEPRALPNAVARYREGVRPAEVPSPLLSGDWYVLDLPARSRAGVPQPRLRLTRTLDVARAVRGALLAHSPQPAPDFLTGHRSSDPVGTDGWSAEPGGGSTSTALSGPHLAVVPLPDVASFHSPGVIQGVALVMPRDCSAADHQAVLNALNGWRQAGLRLTMGSTSGRALELEVGGPEPQPAGSRREDLARTIRRSFWCRSSPLWVTATPIALDRFPGDLRARDTETAEQARSAAETTIRRSCVLAGFPEPVSVAVSLPGLLAAVPQAGSGRGNRPGASFPGYSAGGSGQRRLVIHARIEFAGPVSGPVLIGAGRYLGYGLCLPVTNIEGVSR